MAVFSLFKLVLTSTLLGNAFALPSSIDVEETAVASKLDERSTCLLGNTALSRDCWVEGYDVSTDFDTEWPTTGVTRYYDWTITNTTCAPDGTSRICLLINGVYPGPEITANWGDWIQVQITNNMQNNGTSIHWHGIRQYQTNSQDGVGGITQCPIAPGETSTYLFHATQYGTSWYHSHHSVQMGDGLVGPIVISGPSSENYDIDGGPILVTDWYYKSAEQDNLASTANLQSASPPPPGDNILINGKNKNSAGGGSYTTVSISPLLKTKFRIINTSLDNALRFSIDNHEFDIVTADFVPINPITASSVLLAVGQRYEIIVTGNQVLGTYWMRATVETACGSANNGAGLAIMNYVGWPTLSKPTSTSSVVSPGCVEPSPLVPYVSNTVGNSSAFIAAAKDLEVNLLIPGVTASEGATIVTWGINASAIQVNWDKPTLQYIMEQNTNYPSSENIVNVTQQGAWTYWIVQQTGGLESIVPLPHPMHLHGHDYYILGTGVGVFDMVNDPPTLQYDNPTRRDTTFLPADGWLAIAFPADNPGAWLFHCHIAWHISGGLGAQFLYPPSSIPLPDATTFDNQCAAWTKYDATSLYKQEDSGL